MAATSMIRPRTQGSRHRVSSTRHQWLRSSAAVVVGIATIAGLTSCAEMIDGEALAAKPSSQDSLSHKALIPADFPSNYPASRLRAQEARHVLEDTVGAALTDKVSPERCRPTQLSTDPRASDVLVGQGDQGSLTVIVTRVSTPLSAVEQKLRSCGATTVESSGASAKVTTTVLPPSPVAVAEKLAFRRLAVSGPDTAKMTMQTTALVGQQNGIRVYATFVRANAGKFDGAALDEIFTKAVLKAKK